MGRWLVPAAMVAAALGFAGAAAAMVPARPALWPAAVALALLGGIVPMVYAVTIRVVPVFARRSWRSAAALRAQVGLGLVGTWLVVAGALAGSDPARVLGHGLALASGVLFGMNVALLRRQPIAGPPPPMAGTAQSEVDAVATRLTRFAGAFLIVGLLAGLVAAAAPPAVGRWDLVWVHALTVGFFVSMAAGVSFHVLARWTGRPWPSARPMVWYLGLTVPAVPAMVGALAFGWQPLFAVAALGEAAAIALFVATVAPMVPALPGPTRPAFAAALGAAVAGVALGVAFALDPALGARLRTAHAEINLFGWAGMLVCGAAYYLAPRFAGRPLRWPRLAVVQLALLGGGLTVSVGGVAWRAAGGPPVVAQSGALAVAVSFVLFAAIIAATFSAPARAATGTSAALPLLPRAASTAGRRPAAR